MPISIKTATGYKLVKGVWYKTGGVWKLLPSVHYRTGGAWKVVHEHLPDFVFNVTISANTNNYNLRTAAIAAGWDTVSPLIAAVTINAGVIVGSTITSGYAFSSGSIFPDTSTLTLVNNGTILGAGGRGGNGGVKNPSTAPTSGGYGGPAAFFGLPTTLTNNGTISGGGGGGGGGTRVYYYDPIYPNINGHAGGCGGSGGRGTGTCSPGVTAPSDDSPTSYTSPKAGTVNGPGGTSSRYFGYAYTGAGGAGGGYASSGANGQYGGTLDPAWRVVTSYLSPGVGGAGGAAINGVGLLTFAVTGTIHGAQV